MDENGYSRTLIDTHRGPEAVEQIEQPGNWYT